MRSLAIYTTSGGLVSPCSPTKEASLSGKVFQRVLSILFADDGRLHTMLRGCNVQASLDSMIKIEEERVRQVLRALPAYVPAEEIPDEILIARTEAPTTDTKLTLTITLTMPDGTNLEGVFSI